MMKLSTLTLALVAAASAPHVATGESFVEFRSVDGELLADGEPLLIKGMNWFGAGKLCLYDHFFYNFLVI